ncbi:type II secretion system F family protein [Patescibacteria group bacterium]|nr:MAG: type II secretion system F family protein [Patescibacteria group bacterium]
MASFTYTAKDKHGTIRKGALIATDRSAAASNLIERGLTPILVREQQAKGGSLKLQLPWSNRVSVKDKVVFSRQFATMINAGIPLTQSLAILQEQSTNKSLKKALADITKQVEGGSSLSQAMSAHPKIFSSIYVNLVKAGEAGGLLDQVLERLAIQQEKDSELISKVRGAMIYPGVISTVTVGVFVFLMVAIVPNLASIFEGLGSQLPWYTQLMLNISSVLTKYGLYILGTLIVVAVFGTRYVRTPHGKRQLDHLLLKTPVFGTIITKMNIARFARTFGSLMSAGISVIEALNITANSLGNTVFQDSLEEVARKVKAGKTVSEPLKSMSVFPPVVSQMMAVGEETGKLDEVLVKLATFYEKEVDTMVSGIASIIEPFLIMALGGMVGFIVISVFGPLSELGNAI